jgi:hypothetical protein
MAPTNNKQTDSQLDIQEIKIHDISAIFRLPLLGQILRICLYGPSNFPA